MDNIWAWNAFKGGHYHWTHFASENRDAKMGSTALTHIHINQRTAPDSAAQINMARAVI